MKKLPYPLYLALFLGVLGIIAAGLLAGINILTAPAIKANEEKKLAEQFKVIEVESPKILEVELLENVLGAYEGLTNGKACFVFNVQNKNQFLTVQTLVVISQEDGKILNLSVNLPATTHGMDSSFEGNKFGVIDANQDDFTGKFVTISGATKSSDSVKACINLAYEQYKGIKGV